MQLHLQGAQIVQMASLIEGLPGTIVIDHMGRVDASLGLEQPDFRRLMELLKDKRFWVKVSGEERISKLGPPYKDALPFAKKLVAEFGDRTLWGTDWPHPHAASPDRALDELAPFYDIDDGLALNQLASWAPSAAIRRKILVDNPARLYDF